MVHSIPIPDLRFSLASSYSLPISHFLSLLFSYYY